MQESNLNVEKAEISASPDSYPDLLTLLHRFKRSTNENPLTELAIARNLEVESNFQTISSDFIKNIAQGFVDQIKKVVDTGCETLIRFILKWRSDFEETSNQWYKEIVNTLVDVLVETITNVNHGINDYLDRFVGQKQLNQAVYSQVLAINTQPFGFLDNISQAINNLLKNAVKKVIDIVNTISFNMLTAPLQTLLVLINGLIDRIFPASLSQLGEVLQN